jgi:hypothetical protein
VRSDPASEPSAGFFRFAACVAVVGTVTTAANIGLSEWVPDTGGDPMRAAALSRDPVYLSLQWTLLLHALVTLIPPLALALIRRPVWLGAALLGAVFTGMEKFVELIGQTLRIFVLNGGWRAQLLTTTDPAVRNQLLASQESFNAAWGSMYFVLWLCGSVAALAFAVAFRSSKRLSERCLTWIAAVVAALGFLMILAEYFGQAWAGVAHPAVYFVVMTGYRAAIAWVLWNHVGGERVPAAHLAPRGQ